MEPGVTLGEFDEAVQDGVVLDLQYEARDIDQYITSQSKIDTWFEAKSRGLSDMAKYQLLRRISSRETAEMADVLESYRWQEYIRIKPEIQPIPRPASPNNIEDAIAIVDSTKQ